MTRADKIVRVIDIDTSEADRHHYKIYLTTFADYSDKAKYKIYGNEYRLHPYKWYEIERIWEVPFFYFSSSRQRHFKNIIANKKTLTKAVIRIASWSVSMLMTFIITKYILDKYL